MHSIHISDLDPARCEVGSELVAYIDGDIVTIYHRREGDRLELSGSYSGPAAALAALDVHDIP